MYLSIAKDFSRTPGGRSIHEGQNSGELFRIEILEPAYLKAKEKGETLIIDLDGVISYPPSFLEEAFGGLVRKFKDKKIKDIIEIRCTDEPNLINEIFKNITEAIKNEKK